MQHFQMGSSDSWREGNEQNWEAEHSRQEMFHGNWVDPGEKIRLKEQRKKSIYHLRLRLLLALFSTLVFLLVVGDRQFKGRGHRWKYGSKRD